MHDHNETAPADTTANPYAPPSARIAKVAGHGEAVIAPPFYVVAPWKAALLMFGTFGLYSLYWFWRHWQLHRIDKKLDIWPVARAIFSIFFAHALNQEIDHRINRQGLRHRWSPGFWATLYVVSVIGIRVLNRVAGEALSPGVFLAVLVATQLANALFVFHSQRAANVACGDPEATANRRLTIANGLWLLLGLLLWSLVLLGTLVPEEYLQ